jgi:carbonic anhydrase/acetyltransferase-like protein (isoleucine patch superfamily)
MNIRPFQGKHPQIDPSCYIESSAFVVGDVVMGPQCSLWFNSVVRGDVNSIRIGARTNIQDLCMVHVLKDKWSTAIGDDVTVGHHVVLHGCKVGNRVLIGMGAVLMDGVEIGDDCVIAAGALVTPGTHVLPGNLVLGSPAKVSRPLRPDERAWLVQSSKNYVEYSEAYRRERAK